MYKYKRSQERKLCVDIRSDTHNHIGVVENQNVQYSQQ